MAAQGPTRRDALTWAVGLVLAVTVSAIASAAGARLGAALTGGVVVLVVVVVGALGLERRR